MFVSDEERVRLRLALIAYLDQTCQTTAFGHLVYEVALDDYHAIRWLLNDLFDDSGLSLDKLEQGRLDVGHLFGKPVFWNGLEGAVEHISPLQGEA